MSIPSKLYVFMNERADCMNVEREDAEETIEENVAPPAAQPPTAMNTLSDLFKDFREVTRE
jgi:hypothetical protein